MQSRQWLGGMLCLGSADPGVSVMGSRAVQPPDQGQWAERRALRLLRQQGWRCLAQRWRCRWGEIDLVMAKGAPPQGRLLAVEVKGRSSAGLDGWGLHAFGYRKRSCLARALACWQVENPLWSSTGLEVVLALVPLPPSIKPVRWIRVAAFLHSEGWSQES
jgi:putative endonuclease